MISSTVVLFLFISSCMGYGLFVSQLIRCSKKLSWAEDCACSFAIGIGIVGWIVFWFGIAGMMDVYYHWGILLPGWISVLYLFKNLSLPSFQQLGKFSYLLITILLVTIFLDLLEALAPPADADTLAYHFALPKKFLNEGAIKFVPTAVDGAIPLLTHMTYLLALSLGGEKSLTLWTFATQIYMVLGLYGVGRRWLSHEWSLALILVFQTTPSVIFGGGSGHMEVRTSLFMLIGAIAVMDFIKKKNLNNLIIAALMAGFFMGSKYYGLYAATGIGVVSLLQRNWIKSSMIFAGTVLMAGGQWYFWNWWHSGMPVFPSLYDLMNNPITPYWNESIHEAFKLSLAPECVKSNLLWLLFYPFATTLMPEPCFDSGRVGLGPFLWLLLPGLVVATYYYRNKWLKTNLFYFILPAIIYYFLWFLIPTNQMTRHLLPVYSTVILSSTIILFQLSYINGFIWCRQLFIISSTICIILGLGIHCIFSTNYIKHHFINENRDQYYYRNIGYYNVVKWINLNLTKENKVVNPIRYLNYLIDIPYFYLKINYQTLIRIDSSFEIDKIINDLNKQKISHIIISPKWEEQSIIGDDYKIYSKIASKKLLTIIKDFNSKSFTSRTLGTPSSETASILAFDKNLTFY